MAHSHTSNLIHCVFSTKERRNSIPDPPRLWQFVGGIARQKNTILSKAVQEFKGNASRWLNELRPPFAWQQGYGAFSVSQSQRQTVIDYIDRQAEHHAKWSFEQEYLALLKKSGIAYDPRFVLG